MKRVVLVAFALCLLLCLVGCSLTAKNVEIIAYLDEDLSEAEAMSVGAELNTMPNITQVVFVSKEEALENFLGYYQEDPVVFDGVDLQHRYTISAKTRDVKALVSAIEEIDGIEDVRYFITK